MDDRGKEILMSLRDSGCIYPEVYGILLMMPPLECKSNPKIYSFVSSMFDDDHTFQFAAANMMLLVDTIDTEKFREYYKMARELFRPGMDEIYKGRLDLSGHL